MFRFLNVLILIIQYVTPLRPSIPITPARNLDPTAKWDPERDSGPLGANIDAFCEVRYSLLAPNFTSPTFAHFVSMDIGQI